MEKKRNYEENNPDQLVWEALLTDTRNTDPDKTRKIPKSIFITPNLNESKRNCSKERDQRLGPDGKCYKTLNIDPLDILKTQIALLFKPNQTTTEYDEYDYSEYGDSTESMSSNSNGQYTVPLSLGFADEQRFPSQQQQQQQQSAIPYSHRVIKDDSRIVLGINMDDEKVKQPFLVSSGDNASHDDDDDDDDEDDSNIDSKLYSIEHEVSATAAIPSSIRSATLSPENASTTTATGATIAANPSTIGTIVENRGNLPTEVVASSAPTTDGHTESYSQIFGNFSERLVVAKNLTGDVVKQSNSLPIADHMIIQSTTVSNNKNDKQDAKINDETDASEPIQMVLMDSIIGEQALALPLVATTEKQDAITATKTSTTAQYTTDDEISSSFAPAIITSTSSDAVNREKTVSITARNPTSQSDDKSTLSPQPAVMENAATNANAELLPLSQKTPESEKLSSMVQLRHEEAENANVTMPSDTIKQISTSIEPPVQPLRINESTTLFANENKSAEQTVLSSRVEPPSTTPFVNSVNIAENAHATEPYELIDTYAATLESESADDVPSVIENASKMAYIDSDYQIENTSAFDSVRQIDRDLPLGDDATASIDEPHIELVKQAASIEDGNEYADDGQNLKARLAEELLFQGNSMALKQFETINNSDDSINFNHTSELEYAINGSSRLDSGGDDVTTGESIIDGNDSKDFSSLRTENDSNNNNNNNNNNYDDDEDENVKTIDQVIHSGDGPTFSEAPVAIFNTAEPPSLYTTLLSSLRSTSTPNGQLQQQRRVLPASNNDDATHIQSGNSDGINDLHRILMLSTIASTTSTTSVVTNSESSGGEFEQSPSSTSATTTSTATTTTNSTQNHHNTNTAANSDVDKSIRLGINCYLKNYLNKQYYIICT